MAPVSAGTGHAQHDLSTRRYTPSPFSNRWIGHAGDENEELLHWLSHSPDLTPLDFFLWGYVKDLVYKPPLPQTIPDLRARIIAAIKTDDHRTLQRTWAEIDYRLDVCRVTNGAHIEHL